MWFLQESNQGHMDFQSIALPTELRNRLRYRSKVVQKYTFKPYRASLSQRNFNTHEKLTDFQDDYFLPF